MGFKMNAPTSNPPAIVRSLAEMLLEMRQIPPIIRICRDAVARGNSDAELDIVGKMTAHALRIEALVARVEGQMK